MDGKINSDQLEEGEIVDDDFEDISDNSINDSACGKLVSPYGNLRAGSLSSGSESDRNRSIRHKRKLLRHKCKTRQHRRRKRTRHSSDSSDSDISPPRDLKGKLKEAIHISGYEGAHRNTLETRLKVMGGLAIGTDSTVTEQLLEPPTKRDDVKNSLDKIEDPELEELRLEALKTAVLNKHQRRKRKKALLEGQEAETPLQTQENKENDTPKDKQNDRNNSEKITVNPVDDLDEDEDLLRASLLAGLAKNITKKQTPSESPLIVKQGMPKPPVVMPSVLPKRTINKFKNIINKKLVNKKVIYNQANNKVIQKVTIPKPQVKPLIINVDSDSDSEEDNKQKLSATFVPQVVTESLLQTIPKSFPQRLDGIPQKPNLIVQKPNLAQPKVVNISPNVADLNSITSNVEKFLKEQRKKFETESKNILQKKGINKDKTILEKSAVKLLPKSQQIEYQLLLKKLRTAEKIRKVRKLALQNDKAHRGQAEKAKPNLVEVCQNEPILEASATSENSFASSKIEIEQPVIPVAEKNSNERDEFLYDSSAGSHAYSSKDSETSERKRGITNELTILQKTLKEMKMQKNGSLQIKSKYQTLTPIIRKITSTSNDRKKQEQRIKVLLHELSDARKNLAKSHERFSALVRELVCRKEKIDKSCQDSKVAKRVENGKIAADTKDIKVKLNVTDNIIEAKSVPVTSTPIKSHSEVTNEAKISTFVTSSTNNDCEDMDVCNSDETDICQIDIVDPNDIDQIFKRKPPAISIIPEYVSPLNFNHYERYTNMDPLGIMCPYEVNGSCRDVDCTYKHYIKSDERL